VCRVWGEASGAAARDDLIVVVRGDSAGYPDPWKLRRRCQAGDRLVELGGPPGRHGQQEALGAERQADTIGWNRELANEGHVQLAPTKGLDGHVAIDLLEAHIDAGVTVHEVFEGCG
jgi:hypothetical protein